jgi:hypothetical protein
MDLFEAVQLRINNLVSSIFIDLQCDEVRAPEVPRDFMDGSIVAREKRERRIKCLLKHINPSRENLFLRSIFPWSFGLTDNSIFRYIQLT